MQTLEVYQSRWAMELRRPDGIERSNEEAFAMAAEAGFHGMCLDLGATDLKTAVGMLPLFEQHELGCMITAFPDSIEALRPVLEIARSANASYVNVVGQVFPFTVDEGVEIIHRWMEVADAVQMPIMFETHRACITNDLFYMLQLMQRIPDMPICADLSHYVVGREFWHPISDQNQAFIKPILERAESFQGRVASREQIQLQLGFPQHQKWVEVFKDWWRKGFGHWKRQHRDKDRMIFLTELGPPEYAITGPDGYELSDRWQESLLLKKWVEEIWSES